MNKERFADQDTPLIHDCWYVVALASEVGRDMIDRTVLGQSVLLFRKEDGTAVALQNRCPHRSFPLSHGKLLGDTVQCGYHGMSYDSRGSCVMVPCGKIADGLKLRAYPLVERGPFLWIWPGRPEESDVAKIPDLPWLLEDGKHVEVHGYFFVDASYVSLHENLMDMTHAGYLHGVRGSTEAYAAIPPEVRVENDLVMSGRVEPDVVPPLHYQIAMARVGRRVRRETRGVHFSPCVHFGSDTMTDLEAEENERKVFPFYILHALTPATQTATHYFWANGRDCNIDDADATQAIHERSRSVYYEDVVALQMVQKLRTAERPVEVSVASDHPGLQMRRILARQAANDSSQRAGSAWSL